MSRAPDPPVRFEPGDRVLVRIGQGGPHPMDYRGSVLEFLPFQWGDLVRIRFDQVAEASGEPIEAALSVGSVRKLGLLDLLAEASAEPGHAQSTGEGGTDPPAPGVSGDAPN